jgi:hypothetical protein
MTYIGLEGRAGAFVDSVISGNRERPWGCSLDVPSGRIPLRLRGPEAQRPTTVFDHFPTLSYRGPMACAPSLRPFFRIVRNAPPQFSVERPRTQSQREGGRQGGQAARGLAWGRAPHAHLHAPVNMAFPSLLLPPRIRGAARSTRRRARNAAGRRDFQCRFTCGRVWR